MAKMEHGVHLEHSHKRQWRPYTVFMVLIMGIGSLTEGYAAAVIGPTLAQPTFIAYFDLATRPNATGLISSMNGVFFAGAAIMVLTITFFADRWGRKAAIAVSALVIIISGALLAGSTNIGEFIFFRFVAGAGTWMMLAAVPIWMTEVVPPAIRGTLVDIHGACLLFGYAYSDWLGYGFYFLDSPNAWRAPFAFQCLTPMILLCGIHWLPESPRWLMLKGRHEEARKNLLKLHTPEEAAIEIIQIQRQMEIDAKLEDSYWSMFVKPSYRKRTIIGMSTTAMIQFSGILVINNYGPSIYARLGFDTNLQLIYAAAWLTLAWGCGCLALLVVDRMPRPKLIAIGLMGTSIFLILEAALVKNFAGSTNTSALKAAVAMFFCYVVFYEICLDGTQFVYLGEIFPTHLRAKGMSLGCCSIALMNVMWLQVTPIAFE